MQRKQVKIVLLILICTAALSCNRKAQLVYLGNAQNEQFGTVQPPKYILKSGDVLNIQILTQDEKISKMFSNNTGSGSMSANIPDAAIYLNGYSISDSGYVHVPVLGQLKIAGLDINAAQKVVQESANQYLKDAIVVLKLLSFKVTVIGEVKMPGTYTNYKDNLNVFEAIGLAGDLSDYAERTSVLVVRQTPDGLKTTRINLNDKMILDFDAFYLLPNDIVIVEPRKGKVLALNSPNISLFLSIVSTALLLINYLK